MGDKDFFLDPDDAMTMGDINYMRTSKRTRRTFPKTLSNKSGFAVENEVSSMEDRNSLFTGSNNTVNTGGSVPAQTNQVTDFTPEAQSISQSGFDAPKPSAEKRRPSDNSMDMFRNMAKTIRK